VKTMKQMSKKLCPLCKHYGEKVEMIVIGYVQFVESKRKTKPIPAKWLCPVCGLIIDIT
jgi:rubredoxin